MNPSPQDQSTERPFSGTGICVIGILLVVGGVGFFFARAQLATLRDERVSFAEKGAEAVSQSAAIANAGGAEAPPDAGSPAADPNSTGVEVVTARSPRQPRTDALLQLAELYQEGAFSLTRGSSVLNGFEQGGIAVEGPVRPAFVVDYAGNLSPDFGEFFGLSENEVILLQSAATSIREQINRAIQGTATIEETGPDTYRITIPPLAHAEALRAQFISAFRSVLGEDRYQAFAALNGELNETPEARMQRLFAGRTITPEIQATMQRYIQDSRNGPAGLFYSFGEFGIAATISKGGPSGRVLFYTYNVRQAGGIAGPLGGSGRGSGSNVRERLRLEIGPAVDLLPADF